MSNLPEHLHTSADDAKMNVSEEMEMAHAMDQQAKGARDWGGRTFSFGHHGFKLSSLRLRNPFTRLHQNEHHK